MTSVVLNETWREAMTLLLHQLQVELPDGGSESGPAQASKAPSARSRAAAAKLGAGKKGPPGEVFDYHALAFVNYTKIASLLEDVYDGMVHPQKRRQVKVVLDAVLGRLLEVWLWLVEFEARDPPSLDSVLHDHKLTWASLDLPIPRYFRDDFTALLRQREELLDALLIQKEAADAEREAAEAAAAARSANDADSDADSRPALTGAAAVLAESDAAAAAEVKAAAAAALIRRIERARAWRVHATRMAEAHAAEALRSDLHGLGAGDDNALVGGDGFVDVEAASNLITRVARGHLVRREVRILRNEELQLLGMQREDRREMDARQAAADSAARARKKAVQADHEAEYLAALVNVKQRIYEEEGPLLKEQMEGQIRRWFLSHLRQTGKWPDYPSEAAGGSAKIFLEPPANVPGPAAAAADADGPAAGRGKRTTFGANRRGGDDDDDHIPVPPSAYLTDIQARVLTYVGEWQNKDESDNFEQRHDDDIIRARARPDIALELRVQVDEVMRVELEGIKIKFTGKKKKKKKKGGAKKGAPRQAGAGPAPKTPKPDAGGPGPTKGKRSKRSKDPTAEFSTEELYGELVLAGIVAKPVPGELTDFVGEPNHLAASLRDAGIEPDPSYADVRRAVTMYAIVPLGAAALAARGAGNKGILIAGPRGCGKSMLAQRIAWLTGANVFDLSPSNVKGKYPGKEVNMLLHKVFKVAKAMPPSIVLIEDIDLIFTAPKKLPAEHRGPTGPRRLRKQLLKQVKSLKPQGRVMVVATSAQPWLADFKSLTKVTPRIVHIPRPDYATRALLWRTFIEAKGLFLPDAFDLSTLARLSDGYLAGALSAAVDAVLTPIRARSIASMPLSVAEFIHPLTAHDPLFAEDDAKWRKWLAKLPLAKALRRKKEEAEAAEADRKKNARFRR
ncbi:IQ and AAA domain-containing protein 1 [Thecamonas trahens ATCC 50062]|uniref:IQ and AAA domain-containing protein 1 n=1 Tax=Thecamonas trahens ATCC 50062 TaxID=461836 RepID=A0A0L0D1P8_THETB|nr:IQ and AAA domain-containing protein 1 [Thecamonas trahens ATCC 50062]KNC46177.1 IQ and AAA domain-containing protein 1 [Thecamonas trahens ATCC 50062]|eukprot:XP_013763152.1 IQ and AAA domain-containing protein 1 [Thecamonas trahens ATCC 50062]